MWVCRFFPKFDSNRQTLEDLYTLDALFSVVGEAAEPPQLSHAQPRPLTTPIPNAIPKRFERVWHTPSQILNAFRQIPPGQHERKKLRYDAHALPELADWPGAKRPPLLVHVQAEFEHFPEKVRRRISRVFVLVPKDVRRGGGGCPIDYQVRSDQLTFGYFVPNKKGRMEKVLELDNKWQTVQPVVTVASASPPRVMTSTLRPAPVVAHQPASHPAPQPAAHTPVTALQPPPEQPASPAPQVATQTESVSDDGSDDDLMIIEQLSQQTCPGLSPGPSPRQSPSPAPPPLASRAASSNATPSIVAPTSKRAGKRRAASPAGTSRSAPGRTARSRIEADSVAAVASSSGVPVDVFTPAQKAAVEALIHQRLQAALGTQAPLAPAASKTPAVPASTGAPPSSIQLESSSPARAQALAPTRPTARSRHNGQLIRTGEGSYFSHGYTGTGNKMREWHSLGDLGGFLALSSQGDVVRWDGSLPRINRILKGEEGAKVDMADYSDSWETLVIGYLGPPATGAAGEEGLRTRRPAHQVSLLQLAKTVRPGETGRTWHRAPVIETPHATGVTTIVVQPKTKRLKWVTGGEDKDFYHWTWHASKKTADVNRLRLGHTSATADLAFTKGGDFLLSAGLDKRVMCFDMDHDKPKWAVKLEERVVMVDQVPESDHLFVSRQGLATNQFTLHDLRTRNAAAKFGFSVPFTRNGQGLMVQQNLGRYLRGSWRDSLFVHPDGQQGVHLWDVRYLREAGQRETLERDMSGQVLEQAIHGVGQNKVVHSVWTGEGDLALLGLHGIARVGAAQVY